MTLQKYCSLYFSFFRRTMSYFLKKLRLTTVEDLDAPCSKTIDFFCSLVEQFILVTIFNVQTANTTKQLQPSAYERF